MGALGPVFVAIDKLLALVNSNAALMTDSIAIGANFDFDFVYSNSWYLVAAACFEINALADRMFVAAAGIHFGKFARAATDKFGFENGHRPVLLAG